jgi:hypothetical protein
MRFSDAYDLAGPFSDGTREHIFGSGNRLRRLSVLPTLKNGMLV